MEQNPEKKQMTTELAPAGESNPFATAKLRPVIQPDSPDLSTTKLPPLAKLLDKTAETDDGEETLPRLRLGRNAGITEALGVRKSEFADHAFARAMAKLISEESKRPVPVAAEPANEAKAATVEYRPVEIVPVGLGVLSYEDAPDTYPNLRNKILTAGIALTVLIAAAGIIIGRGFAGGAANEIVSENPTITAPAPVPVSDESTDASKARQVQAEEKISAPNPVTEKSAKAVSRRPASPNKTANAPRPNESTPKTPQVAKETKPNPVPETTSKVTRPRVVNLPK